MKSLALTTCLGENTEPICTAVAEYLSANLQIPVRYDNSVPWLERSRRLDTGEIKIGWICGLLYVQKIERGTAVPLSLLAAPIMAGAEYQQMPIYTSKIIVSRQSNFNSFAGLRGVRFAINEPNSYSGCVLVQAHLAGLGESGNYFGRVIESGSHWRSMEWVADGRVEAAAIDSTLFDYVVSQYPYFQNQLRIVAVLGPSPMPPLVVSEVVPAQLKEQIMKLLLAMATTADGRRLLSAGSVSQFTAVADKDYDPIRQMACQANLVKWDL